MDKKEVLVDKITGMLAGVALGDALGTPHEFFSNDYTGKLEYKVKSKRRFKEPLVGVVGQVSDDTEMTLTLLDQLLEDEGYNQNNVILSYIEWANSDCRFLGKNTRALLKGIKSKGNRALGTYRNRYDKIFETDEEKENSQSNGSLMRCSPLFPFTEDIIKEDCSITNPSSFNVEANIIYCEALNSLLYDKNPDAIVKKIVEKVKTKELRKRIKIFENNNYEEFDVTEKRSWSGHAFMFAMGTLIKPLTFNQVMNWTIGENIKGDTDTNAAISGAIIGMKLGFNNLLKDKVTAENWEIMMACDTEEGELSRPEKYSPRRIPELASEFVDLFLF